MVCEASTELAAQVSAGALELALVTDHAGLHGFELLREERLVWVASERLRVEDRAPIPLALGSAVCLWRRATEEALAASPGITRGLFFSKNYSAIGSVVRAGLAATTLPASMVGEGLRVLGRNEGLPELPMTRMGLIHAPGHASEELRALAEAIRQSVGRRPARPHETRATRVISVHCTQKR